MVDREVDGPVCVVLGRFGGLCVRSWAALGAYVDEKYEEHGYFENMLISRAGARSAASRAVLGRSWTLCWRSWAALGAYVGDLGPLLGLYGRSWAALGASVGGLGCTWAALGTYVRGLGLAGLAGPAGWLG